MEETIIEDSGSETELEDSGEVSLPDLSDEELNSHLESAGKEDSEPTAVESEDIQSTEPSVEEPESTPEPTKEVKSQEPQQAPQQTPPAVDPQAEIQKRDQHIAQLNFHAQRQRSEIATLKQQLEQARNNIVQNLDDKQISDPNGWIQDHRQLEKYDEAIQELEARDEGIVARQQTQQVIATYLDPSEMDLNNIVACLERDPKVNRGYIDQVKNDPIGAMSGDTFIHLAKRARAEQATLGLYSALKSVEKERDSWKQKYEESRKSGSAILRKIDEVAKAKPTISSRNGNVADNGASAINVAELSDKELDEALARAN